MIAFPMMLVAPAKEAGIPVPEDPDNFDIETFVAFTVYCNAQIGRRMPSATSAWTNAKVVAGIPEEKLKTITMGQLCQLGFE